MQSRARIELVFKLVVDLEDVELVAERVGRAMANRARPIRDAEIAPRQFQVRIAQLLAEGKTIVEFVFEPVADLLLADFLEVVIGVAAAQVVNPTVGADDRADIDIGLIGLR